MLFIRAIFFFGLILLIITGLVSSACPGLDNKGSIKDCIETKNLFKGDDFSVYHFFYLTLYELELLKKTEVILPLIFVFVAVTIGGLLGYAAYQRKIKNSLKFDKNPNTSAKRRKLKPSPPE